MTHTYTIESLTKNPTTGLVLHIKYLITTSDGVNTHVLKENLTLTGLESDPDFIAYDNLTEADVLGWVDAGINKPVVEQMARREFNAYVRSITATESVSGSLPWQ
jgi:hypothetical protein